MPFLPLFQSQLTAAAPVFQAREASKAGKSCNRSCPTDAGVIVAQVLPKTPAEKFGIRVGDVILKVNGSAVPHARALQNAIVQVPVGSIIQLTLLRNKKTLDLQMETAPRPAHRWME